MYNYSSIDHAKLLPFCRLAPVPPAPNGWLTGLKAIATQLDCSVQTAKNRINTHKVFAIKIENHWVGNTAWYDETWSYRPSILDETANPNDGWTHMYATADCRPDHEPSQPLIRRTIGGY